MHPSIITSGKKALKQLKKHLALPHSPWLRRLLYFGAGGITTALILPPLLLTMFMLIYKERILPGVAVAGIPAGGMTKSELESQLKNRTEQFVTEEFPITYTYKQTEWNLAFEDSGAEFEINDTVENAWSVGREANYWERTKGILERLSRPVDLPVSVSLDQAELEPLLATISATVAIPEVPPRITLKGMVAKEPKERIEVTPGESGQELVTSIFRENFRNSLIQLQTPEQTLPISRFGKTTNSQELEAAADRAARLVGKKLRLKAVFSPKETQEWTLTDTDMIEFIRFSGGYSEEKVGVYLGEVSKSVKREAKDAKFIFDKQAQKVAEFIPAQEGTQLDVPTTTEAIIAALKELENKEETGPVEVSLARVKPEIGLQEVNDLGIKELIGRGESTFKGSIASRVHNVELAAKRISGTLVKPGEEFSFNTAVGDISQATGFQAAYVIRNGRTELGDGGGVCQDSTTVFRAALDAGLPITERRGHSYRVGYYEQNAKPGLDATVFSPTTDLKFLNDTPGYILVQTSVDTANRYLAVEIYGTSDGRTSEVSNHSVWDVTPPPPDVYVDDPTLAAGQVKQVDWKAWGAKAKFDYSVRRNGETIYEKTFYTTYKPWAAVFLKGTKTN